MNCSYCKNPNPDEAIECEWCGNRILKNDDSKEETVILEPSVLVDIEVLKMLRNGQILNAVKYKMDNSDLDLRASKEYIYNLGQKRKRIQQTPKFKSWVRQNGMEQSKSGCFIATACYGDYESAEVIEFRRYRDEVLLKSAFGRIFVSSYYKVSPPIAKLLEKSESSQRMVRFIILTPLLNLIKSKSKDNNTAS